MRFTNEEIVLYVIAQATRMVRDKDRLSYSFKFGSTDEKEHWMLCHQYKWRMPAHPEYHRGCLYKDRLGRLTRQNHYRTGFHKGSQIKDVFSGKHYSQAFWPLVKMQFELNKDRTEVLADQVLNNHILDLTYSNEPYIELDPSGSDEATLFYDSVRYNSVPVVDGNRQFPPNKVLPFNR